MEISKRLLLFRLKYLRSSLVLVRVQLKCAKGMVAGGGGGRPFPAPCTSSQRHTRVCFPNPQKGPAWGWLPDQNSRDKHQI